MRFSWDVSLSHTHTHTHTHTHAHTHTHTHTRDCKRAGRAIPDEEGLTPCRDTPVLLQSGVVVADGGGGVAVLYIEGRGGGGVAVSSGGPRG